MNFEIKHLLNYNKIEELINNESPNDRADIICENLKYYCFTNKGELYKFDSIKVIYKKIETTIDEELITVISKYISESIKNLNKEQKELLKLKYAKTSVKISENSTINKSLSQIKVGLKRDDENIFTPDFYQIHFQNGYLDLKTLVFKKRIMGINYVNLYIKRDYKASSQFQFDKLYSIINKIYPKKEDLEAILFILGSAMTGKVTKLQKLLFLIGQGSAGKSTIMIITQKAVECYLETLEEDAFSESNKNADKTFSTFYNKQSVRIIWTNEPKEDKMNKSTFKKFCEGEMKGKLLYKNGSHDFKHFGLPIFTSNIMPNINVDSGVKRRFRCYIHTSEFTSDKSKVDEKKHIYLLNRDLIENIIEEDLLNTWIDILAQYANKWINGEEIPIPKSFKEATEEIIETNDNIQDFIDVKLTITTNGIGKADRIGKNEMIEIYKEMYPNRGMNHQILKSSLCERGIDWDKEIRGKDGIKGCYYNVIRKNENINNNEDDNNYKFGKSPIDYGIESDDLNIVNLKNENSELKIKLKDLEAQILQLQLPKKEEIKQVQINEDDIKELEKELNDACNNFKPKQQEPEPENKFDDNDINDILGFIENSKNNKKSKKSKK
jgi:phage/plasmid-associated DNA primase